MSRAHKSYVLTSKEKATIVAMYDSGRYSFADIAGVFNVAKSTVAYYVNNKAIAAAHKRYYLKNRPRILKYMREYKNKNKL